VVNSIPACVKIYKPVAKRHGKQQNSLIFCYRPCIFAAGTVFADLLAQCSQPHKCGIKTSEAVEEKT
jgi:hypothetical protein